MTMVKPDVPGTVVQWIGETSPRILPAAADTMALPVIHDWGPIFSDTPGPLGTLGGVQELTDFNQWTTLFGDSDTPGRTAVAGAFAGQNLPGAGGAGGVIVARMAGSAAAFASVAIHNTAGGAPLSLTLTGLYKGSRANSFGYIIDVDPSNATRDRLRLTYQGQVRETYLYANTDIVALAAAINLRSKMVTATEAVTGVRLVATPGTAFAGGNDGATLVAQNHIDALTSLQFKPFGVIAPFDVTDPTIQAVYTSWAQGQQDNNRPCRLVVGGLPGETIDDALARTVLLADEHVINVGCGTWHDDLLNKDLSTSQLAPRIAGIIAAKGQAHSATFAKIGGLHPVGLTAPSSDDVVAAVTGGVLTLMQTSAADADVRIAKAVTTFTSTIDPIRPIDVFSDARLIGVMDNYVRDMTMWGDDIVIGALPVNDDTRGLVLGYARKLQDALLTAGLILPGDGNQIPVPFVVVQVTDADPTLRDAIPYTFGWQFARTTNAILAEGHVR